MAKYMGLVSIENERDVERFKQTSLYEPAMDEVLKGAPGTWLHFDIDYLSIFKMSREFDDLLNHGLVVAIKKVEG